MEKRLCSYQWKSFSLCTCRSTNDIPNVLMIGCYCIQSCVLASFYTLLVAISCMQGFTIIFLINKRSYGYPKYEKVLGIQIIIRVSGIQFVAIGIVTTMQSLDVLLHHQSFTLCTFFNNDKSLQKLAPIQGLPLLSF